MAEEHVVLVDANDTALGEMEKLAAHKDGVLHRAFSAYVVRERDGEAQLLLQRRATAKYHFGGLWTNTCCGHPLRGEAPADAGRRRLAQEMNFSCELVPVGAFTYQARSANGLCEHEYDHVLLGHFDGEVPAPNPSEVDDLRWVSFAALDRELALQPETFTPWFGQGYALIKAALRRSV
jgi:isopentenyl-diphosphate delta-isomerase